MRATLACRSRSARGAHQRPRFNTHVHEADSGAGPVDMLTADEWGYGLLLSAVSISSRMLRALF